MARRRVVCHGLCRSPRLQRRMRAGRCIRRGRFPRPPVSGGRRFANAASSRPGKARRQRPLGLEKFRESIRQVSSSTATLPSGPEDSMARIFMGPVRLEFFCRPARSQNSLSPHVPWKRRPGISLPIRWRGSQVNGDTPQTRGEPIPLRPPVGRGRSGPAGCAHRVYPRTKVKVGLETSSGAMPSPSARPLTKQVFPAPSGPSRLRMSEDSTCEAIRRPKDTVSSSIPQWTPEKISSKLGISVCHAADNLVRFPPTEHNLTLAALSAILPRLRRPGIFDRHQPDELSRGFFHRDGDRVGPGLQADEGSGGGRNPRKSRR